MEISKYNIIYCQVAWIDHWLNKLGRLFYAPPGSVADVLYRSSNAFATESLVNYLRQNWISIDSRKLPLGNITNKQTERREKKRGRKSSKDKRENDNMVKMVLIGLVTDSKCRPVHA